jgi:hypothetical protein
MRNATRELIAFLLRNHIRPYAIVAGNPAMEIRRRFDDDTINDLLEIGWWNWTLVEIEKAMPLLLSPDIRAFIAYCKNKRFLSK